MTVADEDELSVLGVDVMTAVALLSSGKPVDGCSAVDDDSRSIGTLELTSDSVVEDSEGKPVDSVSSLGLDVSSTADEEKSKAVDEAIG